MDMTLTTANQSTGLLTALRQAGPQVLDLPVGSLHTNPDNDPARIADGPDMDQLVASIHAVGVLCPLLAVPDPNGGELVLAGHRRLEAAIRAGLDTVPVIVREDLNASPDEVLLHENQPRLGLSAMEEAKAYQRLLDKGWTQARIAQDFGITQSAVAKRVALLVLPEPIQAWVNTGRIGVTEAYEAATKEPTDRLETAVTIMAENPATTFSTAQREALYVERQRTSETAAQQKAAQVKARYVPLADLDTIPKKYEIWSYKDKVIKDAAQNGTLIVSGSLYSEEPSYWSTVPLYVASREDEEAKQRKAEEKARYRYLAQLATRQPTAEQWKKLALAYMMSATRPEATSRAILRHLHKDHGVPLIEDSWGHIKHPGTDEMTASWLVGLACAESLLRGTTTTAPLVLVYTDLLASVGYHPTTHPTQERLVK